MPSVVTELYKINLVDIETRAFILLKSHQKNRTQFVPGDSFLIDKVKLVINQRGQVILESTTLTVLRSESEDSFTVESLELSQKQHDDVLVEDFIGNEMLAKESAAIYEMIKVPYIMTEANSEEPPLFTST